MKKNVVRKRNYLYEGLTIVEIAVICLPWYLALDSWKNAFLAGAITYLVLAWGLRLLLQRHHRKGMQLSRAEQYEAALECFEKSEAFFARNSWIDKYRFITMFSSSAYGYREMALQNQGFALLKLNRPSEAIVPYEKLLALTPERKEIAEILKGIRLYLLKEEELSKEESAES